MELICLGMDHSSASTMSAASPHRGRSAHVRLPLLCVYTKKDVFLLKLSYESTGVSEVEGTVVAVEEPFEDFLLGHSAANIIRIQPAPQKSRGYSVMCPSGAMAMLSQDAHTSEYTLCLYHGVASTSGASGLYRTTATSHLFGMEELADPAERIVDFCFCQSKQLPLLSSLTVAFLKGTGMVLFATPIVFPGTVVNKSTMAKTIDFLEASIQEEEPRSAHWNQLMAAKRFLIDAFPTNGQGSLITTTFKESNSPAFDWGVQLQGPLIELEPPEDDKFSGSQFQAKAIVPFEGADDLVGFAVCFASEVVDIAVASPSALLPRFTLETFEDGAELDSTLAMGVCVNRVYLSSSDAPVRNIHLIPDPIMDCLVHLVTPEHVISVSTNTARVAANKAREASASSSERQVMFSPPSKRSDLKPKTTAWSCLDVSFLQGSLNPVVGAVISNDVQFGHILVVRLMNGNVVAVNLTEKRHLSEMESVFARQPASLNTIEGSHQHTESLADAIQPALQKVYDGISKMRQLGGSATQPEKMTVEDLAGAMEIHRSCKIEVYLPLVEMNEIVNARREDLKEMVKKQTEAVKSLKELIGKLREKQSSIQERSEIVAVNAKSLADRSASVLQESIDCQPTITQAEYDYFQQLKKSENLVARYASEAERLKVKALSLVDDIEKGATGGPQRLPESEEKDNKKILGAMGSVLEKNAAKIDQLGSAYATVAALSGWGQESTE
jgi:hypothetical protein